MQAVHSEIDSFGSLVHNIASFFKNSRHMLFCTEYRGFSRHEEIRTSIRFQTRHASSQKQGRSGRKQARTESF